FAQEPGYCLSGDFVFSGDLGRPDLLDEAAGMQDTRFEGAKQLFTSLKNAFLTLPDHVQVFPGHGAGSACGKAIGALPSTTVGYDRKSPWWAKRLAADDEQGFVDELLDGQPDAHAYFARMKRQNKDGPALLGDRRAPRLLTADELSRGLEDRSLALVDTRPVDQVHAGTVPRSEEHTSELQSRFELVSRHLLEKKHIRTAKRPAARVSRHAPRRKHQQ